LRRQRTGEGLKPFSGGRLPRDMACLKIHTKLDQSTVA
jgi:hypothetical protein